MKVTFTTADGSVFNTVDVSEDMEIDSFAALCKADIPQFAGAGLTLIHQGKTILDTDKQSLKSHGISDGDVVMLEPMRIRQPQSAATGAVNPLANIDWSRIALPSGSGSASGGTGPPGMPDLQALLDQKIDMEVTRLQQEYDADASMRTELQARAPTLADALKNKDRGKVRQFVHENFQKRQQAEMERMRALADPMSAEAQRLIEQEIRNENIHHSYETAMEHMPEAFGQVVMLYIKCKVNGHELKAFVDSGAQTTIMSKACAERCHIERLVDERFQGVAMGVGTQKIIGRIHMAQLQIDGTFLPTSFTVLEDQTMDVLLGLDMLKRHQCIIDLSQNKLVIGTTGTSTPFLSEDQVPMHARLNGDGGGGAPATPSISEDAQLAEALQRSANETKANTSAAQSSAAAAVPDSPNNPTQTPSGSTIDPKVAQLMKLGVSRAEAERELRAQNGDVMKAQIALLTKSLPSNKK